jgi:hypothetical protein
MAKDIAHEYKFSQGMIPAHTLSTPSPTATDTAGFESTMFVFDIGAIGSSATLRVHFHDGASSSPTTDVVAADLEIYNWTTPVAVTTAYFDADDGADSTIVTVQYKGTARYVVPVPTIGVEHYDMGYVTVQGFARHPMR